MKIALLGYGKMGKTIEEIALQRKHEITLKVSSTNKSDLTAEHIRLADVAIEFSKPDAALDNIVFCLNNGIPVVSGTTGWLKDYETVKDICQKSNGTFLYASNFSIGVNIFFEVNRHLAKLMAHRDEYDISLQEIHHVHKKDAPSGTAITLANQIIAEGKKEQWSLSSSDEKKTLHIDSVREGEVPGTHSIKYVSGVDEIEIIHTAFNRKGFASGAVLAAEFIRGKKGIFTMKDVLGL